ncbi:MAG TPA: secretin N-terminal domain-containing protein [Gemmatimonadota bacterium]|nr:secretin N-terminal domain-containing protein [Gemmatimonadota bacterium]
MKLLRLGLVLLLLAPAGSGAVRAQSSGAEATGAARTTSPPAADSGFTFNFQSAQLRTVLAALAQAAGLSIVLPQLPNKTVTVRTARPVTAGEADSLLASLAEANDLTVTRQGSLVRVTVRPAGSRQGARTAARDSVEAPSVRLWVIHLQHARAENLASTLDLLFGIGGGFGSSLSQAGGQSLSQSLADEAGMSYRAMEPTPHRPSSATPAPAPEDSSMDAGLRAVLGGPVRIVPDPRTNTILVLAAPDDFRTIKGAVAQLDVRPLQVLIEVMIAEVTRDHSLGLGSTVDVPTRSDSQGVGFSLQGLSAGDVALKVLGIGSIGASAVLRALAASSDVKILSRPVVLAENNHEARILVGDQRPFIQLFRALPTDQAVRDQVVQYKNVGTQLTLTPTISQDGYVNLVVRQEVSNATNEVQFGAPVINTRESETEVLIKNGHTAVLGGLIDHQVQTSRSGIPLLKDIPLIGGLFGSTQKRNVSTELFILLTPHVLRTDTDMDSATRSLRDAVPAIGSGASAPSSILMKVRGLPSSTTHPPLPSPDTVSRPAQGGRGQIPGSRGPRRGR